MSVSFEPVLQLDAGKPTRVEAYVPLDLLPRFDPTAAAGPLPDQDMDLIKATKPAAFTIAQAISTALFGSTQSIPQPFATFLTRGGDGIPKAVGFILNHRIDDINLNPDYIYVSAKDFDGRVVFGTSVLTGGRQKRHNEIYEGTDLLGEQTRALL
ncbi:hypothetical protein F5Y06DRAFT_148011 [Hypoxylon sp. FL0890]|nr:hypothetical protein F5Y06DRAFT_148011 [Hypoxylon sp. FL0890]